MAISDLVRFGKIFGSYTLICNFKKWVYDGFAGSPFQIPFWGKLGPKIW